MTGGSILMDKNNLTTLAKDVYRVTLLFPSREPLRYKLREVADEIISEFIMKRNDYLGSLARGLELIDSYFQVALDQDWTSPARIYEIKSSYARISNEVAEAVASREEEIAANQPFQEKMVPSRIDKPEPVVGQPSVIICPPAKELIELSPSPKEVMAMPAPEIALMDDVLPIAAAEGLDNQEDETGEDSEADEGSGLSAGQIVRQNRIVEFLKEKGSAQVWEIQKIFPQVSKRTIRRDFRSMLKQGLIERTGERNTTAYKLKINIS